MGRERVSLVLAADENREACRAGRTGYNVVINARDGSHIGSRALENWGYPRTAVFAGSEVGFFWVDEWSGNAEIHMTRVDLAAAPLAENIRLTQTSSPSLYPSAAWDGIAYGLTWHDSDGLNDAVYFARFAPCP